MIREMNKDDLRNVKVKNFILACVWIIVLLVLTFCIRARVVDEFLTQGDAVSVHEYNRFILFMWVITVLVAIIWWISATFLTGEVRRVIEEYSFLCSLACIILVIGAAVVIFGLNHIILDSDGQPYTLWFVFLFPVVFGCLMYWLPPVNLKKVIWPFGPRIVAVVISALILLFAVLFLK